LIVIQNLTPLAFIHSFASVLSLCIYPPHACSHRRMIIQHLLALKMRGVLFVKDVARVIPNIGAIPNSIQSFMNTWQHLLFCNHHAFLNRFCFRWELHFLINQWHVQWFQCIVFVCGGKTHSVWCLLN
jgi:hypothetical protein